MEIAIYLQPIEIPDYQIVGETQQRRMGDLIQSYSMGSSFPDLAGVQLALIGIRESSLSVENYGCKEAPDAVRKYLYRLYAHNSRIKIADLGNINAGFQVEDTLFAAKSVIEYCLKNNIVPIIIGGSQDLTYANYMAYENLGQIINIASVDCAFDLGNAEETFNSKSFLSKIILHQPNFLFNYTNIGYQTYYVDYESIKLMSNLFFDVYRLGELRSNIEEVEPLVRNADLISFDISSIRQAEAPGNAMASPNGFDGEEACRIARYAGLSDKVTSFGIYEINPEFDRNGQTAHLAAEIIWYFIEGYYQRKGDFPHLQKDDYKKYTVGLHDHDHDIVFYESKKSGRWWMQVPLSDQYAEKFQRHFMVACSKSDYDLANTNEIPDKWWQVYQKLM
jgi:arginase family enzyme